MLQEHLQRLLLRHPPVQKRRGGTQRAGKGSHCNIKMPNGQLITIPRHGELKVGLLGAALKKAGLSVDDFLELIGRQT